MTHPIKRYSQTKYLISQYWSFYRNEITSRSCKMKEWITEIGIISTKLSELYATLSLCLTWQNHEKIRKVDTKCTFLFRNYYFFANWVPANPVKAMNYETFGNGYTTCGYGGLCVISKSVCNLLLKIFEAKEVFPYLVPSWRLIFVPQTVCGWQITLGRIDPCCVFSSLKAKHWACWVSASCN